MNENESTIAELKRIIGGVRHENERLRGIECALRTDLAAKGEALREANVKFAVISRLTDGTEASDIALASYRSTKAALAARTPGTEEGNK